MRATRSKKSVLELGGSDPFIVLPSADLDACVRTAVTARVQNNGQSCIAAKRFIVADAIADEFLARFTAAMDALVVGDPFDPATDVGPIVTEAQRDELIGQVEAARAQGATVHAGARGSRRRRLVLPPDGALGRDDGHALHPGRDLRAGRMVIRVPDLDAALAAANATSFGLGSSVWTTDDEEVRRCVEGIEAGAVFVNAMVASMPEMPFGGIKRSGFGRELAELGLKEFANAKTVYVA